MKLLKDVQSHLHQEEIFWNNPPILLTQVGHGIFLMTKLQFRCRSSGFSMESLALPFSSCRNLGNFFKVLVSLSVNEDYLWQGYGYG